MKITRKNYEAYFLDYIEGNLPDEQVDELLDFLKENQDLQAELKTLQQIPLEPDNTMMMSGKDTIKYPADVDREYFMEQCVAFYEGDLTEEEKKSVTSLVNRFPLLKKEFRIFSQLKVASDHQIKFPGKKQLKKKAGIIPILNNWVYYASAVAAGIILFLVFEIFISTPEETQITRKENTPAENLQKTEQKGSPSEKEISIKETEGNEHNAHLSERQKESKTAKPTSPGQKKEPVLQRDEVPVVIARDERMDAAKIPMKDPLYISSSVIQPDDGLLASIPSKKKNIEEFLTVKQVVISEFKSGVLKEDKKNIDNDKILVVDFADAGIKGINKLLGMNMQLDKLYNEEGELVAYAFQSKIFHFSRQVQKE